MKQTGLIDRGSRFLGEKLSFVYLASMVVIAWEVAARYLFNAPTVWAHETTITLTAIGFSFSGVYTLQRREHIRITVIYDLLSPRWQRILDIFNGTVTVAFGVLFGYATAIVAWRAIEVMETSASAWNQPTPTIMKTALFLGSLMLALQGIAQFVSLLRDKDPGG